MDKPIRILGIDPGFASMGVARIRYMALDDIDVEALHLIATKKATKKKRADLRVSADDVQRARRLWDGMSGLVQGIDALAYEVYTPFQGGTKRTANGTKTAMACGLALGLGFSLGVPVIPVLPSDVKREVVGRVSASKDDVQEALYGKIAHLGDGLESFRATQRNHVSDAAAVAFVGLLEILRWRELTCGL